MLRVLLPKCLEYILTNFRRYQKLVIILQTLYTDEHHANRNNPK